MNSRRSAKPALLRTGRITACCSAAGVMMCSLSGCGSPAAPGIGTIGGTAVGAAIGSFSGNAGNGALIGGLLGYEGGEIAAVSAPYPARDAGLALESAPSTLDAASQRSRRMEREIDEMYNRLQAAKAGGDRSQGLIVGSQAASRSREAKSWQGEMERLTGVMNAALDGRISPGRRSLSRTFSDRARAQSLVGEFSRLAQRFHDLSRSAS